MSSGDGPSGLCHFRRGALLTGLEGSLMSSTPLWSGEGGIQSGPLVDGVGLVVAGGL